MQVARWTTGGEGKRRRSGKRSRVDRRDSEEVQKGKEMRGILSEREKMKKKREE